MSRNSVPMVLDSQTWHRMLLLSPSLGHFGGFWGLVTHGTFVKAIPRNFPFRFRPLETHLFSFFFVCAERFALYVRPRSPESNVDAWPPRGMYKLDPRKGKPSVWGRTPKVGRAVWAAKSGAPIVSVMDLTSFTWAVCFSKRLLMVITITQD